MIYTPYIVILALAQTPNGDLEQVEVRAAALQAREAAISGITSLTREQIEAQGASHPNELFDAVPGAWISRGSGQEHLAALRSPVLTGPGSCGAFMIQEDHVPIRPVGFCNVNELFELNLLQADRVDVLRGPGSVIYGSNALHGVIDAASREPDGATSAAWGLEAGSEDFYRGRLELNEANFTLYGNFTSAGSFRLDEGYQLGQANGVWMGQVGNLETRTQMSWANLDQDTAGFIPGYKAYEDPELRHQNFNPDAFREAEAWRISGQLSWAAASGAEIRLTPFARYSDMRFLQHFLPGQPLEDNDQSSAGLLFDWVPEGNWRAGLDFEWAEGGLVEYQAGPVTEGSAFVRATRPQGFHYDYEVRQLALAAWIQSEIKIHENMIVTYGIRGDTLTYEYDNQMLDGNTRDDGTPCPFGGCLYTRPADSEDHYSNWAPEFGLHWTPGASGADLSARLARGFRVPQATELYRLQSGQQVADIDSETLDTLELGWQQAWRQLDTELTAFVMRKENFIFRDADGYNVSDGETRHYGAEAAFNWAPTEAWLLSGNLAWARHEYAFDRIAAGSEIIRDGNLVDTAPEWLGALRVLHQGSGGLRSMLEWVHLGEHFIDAANLHEYPGHELLNLNLSHALPGSAGTLGFRVNNVLDDYYAERADFAFNDYRYLPGAGRQVFIEWRQQMAN